MKPITTICLLLTAVFCTGVLSSCGERPATPAEELGLDTAQSVATEEDANDVSAFSDWYSKAELQILLEGLEAGMYYSVIEGRCMEGLHQYRAAIEPFADNSYDMWATYWGLDEGQFYETELMLLRQGFRRKHLHAYQDSGQRTMHQLVYVRPTGSAPRGNGLIEQAEEPELPQAGDAIETEQAASVLPPPEDTSPPPSSPAEVTPAAQTIYTVVAGDTLSRISVRTKISVAVLKAENNLKSDMLRVGQKLRIPAKK